MTVKIDRANKAKVNAGSGPPDSDTPGNAYLDEAAKVFYLKDENGNWFSSSGGVANHEEIHVNSHNGSDTTGDGSLASPYETLGYACSQQLDPTNQAEFLQPITFCLAPGVYNISGDASIPQRMHVTITGDNCSITGGKVHWNINPTWWDTFSLSTNSATPSLRFVRKPSIGSFVGSDAVIPNADYPQGFRLVSGGIEACNSNPLDTYNMPDSHTLLLNGVTRDGWFIYNRPADTGNIADVTKTMILFLQDSITNLAHSNPICGESDMGAGVVLHENTIWITARRSALELQGVCRLGLLEECYYSADYRLDHLGTEYDHGKIDGAITSMYGGENIRTSVAVAPSFFGITDPARSYHSRAQAIIFDEESLIGMASVCSNLTTSFSYFLANSDGAYTRGWWNGYSEYAGNHAKTFIPSTPMIATAEGAGTRLFRHAHHVMSNWEPNRKALSIDNAFYLELGSGEYTFTSEFVFNKEHVGVIGTGAEYGKVVDSFGDVTILNSGTVLSHGNNVFSWNVDHGQLENLTIVSEVRSGLFLPNSQNFLIQNEAAHSTFKKLIFRDKNTWTGTTTAAVEVDLSPTDYLQATWEDCHTDLDGFLFGGNLDCWVHKCTAQSYSFGAWSSASDRRHITILGAYDDCHAKLHSFGTTEDVGGSGNGGGDVSILGVQIKNSSASGRSFGYADGDIVLSGNFQNNRSGARSFGYAYGNDVTIQEATKFSNCYVMGDLGFGCTENSIKSAAFNGEATDCTIQNFGFGACSTLSTQTSCGPNAKFVNCIAKEGSYGGRGSFEAMATNCQSEGGSFGVAGQVKNATLLNVLVLEIQDSRRCPVFMGATLKDCIFKVKTGEDVAPVILNGDEGEETRMYNCDLYTDTHNECIGRGTIPTSPSHVKAKIAHCRMNKDIDAEIDNLIVDSYNIVSEDYDL